MTAHNPYDKYRDNIVYTATKEELTLMLYDGALKFCNQAIVALESKDLMKANELIIRIQEIIREFQLTLNRSVQVSKYFDSMYDYMHTRLLEANVKKDKEILAEIRDLIREFRDMWKDAMKLSKQHMAKSGT